MMRLIPYLLLLWMAYYSVTFKGVPQVNNSDLLERIKAIHQEQHPNTPFSFYKLGYASAPMYPYGVYDNIYWDYHFDHLWPLQGMNGYYRRKDVVNFGEEKKSLRLEKFVVETVVGDLQRTMPSILLFEPYFLTSGSLRKSADFKQLMSHYTFYETFHKVVDYCRLEDVMDIYVRKF